MLNDTQWAAGVVGVSGSALFRASPGPSGRQSGLWTLQGVVQGSSWTKRGGRNNTKHRMVSSFACFAVGPLCTLRSPGRCPAPQSSDGPRIALRLLSALCAHRLDSCEVEFMQVGHTHAEQDQLFAGVATVLSAAPSLEEHRRQPHRSSPQTP